MRRLGSRPDEWNSFATNLPEARSKIERDFNRKLTRDIIGRIDNSELRVLLFVAGRTLSWLKFAEAIPMSHFQKGIRDANGMLDAGDDDLPYCSGVGISKADTIRAAVGRLRSRNLLTVFEGRPGSSQPANVYMPFGLNVLASALIEAGSGVLPSTAPLTVGEHVVVDQRLWRITGLGPEEARCERVTGSGPTHEYQAFNLYELRRMTLRDWIAFRKGEKRLRHDT